MSPSSPQPTPTPILFLHRGGEQIRGSENALLTLLDRLDRSEFRPLVVCSNDVLAKELMARGIDCSVEDFPEIVFVPDQIAFPLIRYLRTLKRLIGLSRRANVRVVFSNGGGPCQLGVPLAGLLRLRCMCLFHHPAPKTLHFFWLTAFADVMIFASEFTAAHTRERIGPGGHVVHIGVDSERFSPAQNRNPGARRDCNIGLEEVVFAQIGALVPTKGHDVLLRAFAQVRKVLHTARLLIIGTGPEAERIRQLVDDLGLSSCVTLTGYVKDTIPFLRHIIDVNVLPSFEEGLGLVNLQASACALPNIASNGTGIRETIIHGRTGFLFTPGDSALLASYMMKLACDRELRVAMGKEGRRYVIEQFSPTKYASRIQEVIREAIPGTVG
jgi:glycosyltransferase involved in cell wall biosynthesis